MVWTSDFRLKIKSNVDHFDLWYLNQLARQSQTVTQTHVILLRISKYDNKKKKQRKSFENEGSILIFRYSDIWFDRVRITQRLLIKHYGAQHSRTHKPILLIFTDIICHSWQKKGFTNVIDAFYQRIFLLLSVLFVPRCSSCHWWFYFSLP